MLPKRYECEISEPGERRAVETNRDWWAQARCNDLAGSASWMFFSNEVRDIARAKQFCALCPVMAECLEGALERREPCGVWGGQLFLNGKVLHSKRRRGRPPKVARTEDQVPDIPVPKHLRELVRTAAGPA